LGNCFYEAIARQLELKNFPIPEIFPATTVEGGQTALADIIRLRSGTPYQDRTWASPEEMKTLMGKLNLIVGIVDTRDPKHTLVYYYTDNNAKFQFTSDKNKLPGDRIILELAYTGNHYLCVASKPSNIISPKSSLG